MEEGGATSLGWATTNEWLGLLDVSGLDGQRATGNGHPATGSVYPQS